MKHSNIVNIHQFSMFISHSGLSHGNQHPFRVSVRSPSHWRELPAFHGCCESHPPVYMGDNFMQWFHGLVTVVLWELITIHRFDTMLHDFQEESISQPEIPTYLSNCTPKRQKQWIIDSSPLQTSSPVPIPCQTWQSGNVVKRVLDKYISGWINTIWISRGTSIHLFRHVAATPEQDQQQPYTEKTGQLFSPFSSKMFMMKCFVLQSMDGCNSCNPSLYFNTSSFSL